MQREELEQVRRLYRLFLAYERVEAAGDKLPERRALIPALVRASNRCWSRFFGPTLARPAHRRFVLEWCLRNVELLMKEEVLPVIAHQVVAQAIQSELMALSHDGAAHDFGALGPQGPSGTPLRRVYLIQSLNQLLAGLALEGQIPARLATHLTSHLIKRVRGLFAQAAGDESTLPDLPSVLATLTDAIPEEVALKLLRIDGAAAPAPSGSSSRVPIAARGADEELTLMAGAAELMRRLRRLSSLAPEDRDRLIKHVEIEMDALLAALGPDRLDRALATLADRIGIPVPPARDPGSSGTIPIRAEKRPDSSDFQWALELVEDLRRDSADDAT